MGFNEISSLYEIGSIVELKVEKKLLEPQLVIFNLDGVSARLHISNISNSTYNFSRDLIIEQFEKGLKALIKEIEAHVI